MRSPRRPAAYLHPTATVGRQTLQDTARRRGWPQLVVYTDDQAQPQSALERVTAAILAGRHDALLMATPGAPGPLMKLLMQCTKLGVPVCFVPPPAGQPSPAQADLISDTRAAGAPVLAAPAAFAAPAAPIRAAAATMTAPILTAAAAPPAVAIQESWDLLAQARMEALKDLFPAWRIWLDPTSWHACRRDQFLQYCRPAAPVFHIAARSAIDLAGQLCWQQAADQRA